MEVPQLIIDRQNDGLYRDSPSGTEMMSKMLYIAHDPLSISSKDRSDCETGAPS